MLNELNQPIMFVMIGGILLFIIAVCLLFMLKSYKAGLALGMNKTVLQKAITSTITFTILPTVSVLLGVIALSGALGLPFSWLRLSVIGSLQYELQAAEIVASHMGMSGLRMSEMTPDAFVTMGLVITSCISFGAVFTVFGLKAYLKKVRSKSVKESTGNKPSLTVLFVAMFIGVCGAYVGAYVGMAVRLGSWLPLLTAVVAGLVMAIFDYLIVKKNMLNLESFSLAASMLIAMISAIAMNLWLYY